MYELTAKLQFGSQRTETKWLRKFLNIKSQESLKSCGKNFCCSKVHALREETLNQRALDGRREHWVNDFSSGLNKLNAKHGETFHMGFFHIKVSLYFKSSSQSFAKCYIRVTLLLGFEGKSNLYAGLIKIPCPLYF